MTHVRYVILRHDHIAHPHFDLMFEASPGSNLLTWRSEAWPPEQGAHLTRLAEHRRDYLDYEGPVSNDRGEVHRIAAGECKVNWPAPHECHLTLDSLTLQLKKLDDEHWLATLIPAENQEDERSA